MIIGAADTLPALKERIGDANGAVLVFSDLDAIDALNTITTRRASLVVLERLFALTTRGAALIHRIKADPTLKQSEIRVLAHNSDYTRVIARMAPPSAPALDQRGTRRAARFVIAAKVTIEVDGKQGGAGGPLDRRRAGRVAGRVETESADRRGGHRRARRRAVQRSVAWTKYEMRPTGGPVYRAGIDFENADARRDRGVRRAASNVAITEFLIPNS